MSYEKFAMYFATNCGHFCAQLDNLTLQSFTLRELLVPYPVVHEHKLRS